MNYDVEDFLQHLIRENPADMYLAWVEHQE